MFKLLMLVLGGSKQNMDTSMVQGKDTKSKGVRKKKQSSSKFMSLGKDQTVSILHGVGRVLNPKGICTVNIKTYILTSHKI